MKFWPESRSGKDSGGAEQRASFQQVKFSKLTAVELESLADEMGSVMVNTVTASGAGDWAVRYWEWRRTKLTGCSGWLVRVGGDLAGYVLYEDMELQGRPCLYLHSAYFLPEFQGHGFARSVNIRLVVNRMLCRFGSNQLMIAEIYNPAIAASWLRRIVSRKDFYPGFGVAEPLPELERVAAEFAATVFPDNPFDPTTGVFSDRSEPRKHVSVQSGIQAIDDHFAAHVHDESGDTQLLVINGSPGSILRNVWGIIRTVPAMIFPSRGGVRSGAKRAPVAAAGEASRPTGTGGEPETASNP